MLPVQHEREVGLRQPGGSCAISHSEAATLANLSRDRCCVETRIFNVSIEVPNNCFRNHAGLMLRNSQMKRKEPTPRLLERPVGSINVEVAEVENLKAVQTGWKTRELEAQMAHHRAPGIGQAPLVQTCEAQSGLEEPSQDALMLKGKIAMPMGVEAPMVLGFDGTTPRQPRFEVAPDGDFRQKFSRRLGLQGRTLIMRGGPVQRKS